MSHDVCGGCLQGDIGAKESLAIKQHICGRLGGTDITYIAYRLLGRYCLFHTAFGTDPVCYICRAHADAEPPSDREHAVCHQVQQIDQFEHEDDDFEHLDVCVTCRAPGTNAAAVVSKICGTCSREREWPRCFLGKGGLHSTCFACRTNANEPCY